MKVSLLSKILPESLRVPLVIWLRKKGVSTAVQSLLYSREARVLKRVHASDSVISEEALSKMKVLVVCAHFNHALFLPDCISSLINSSHTNWELMIVDDRSTDSNALNTVEAQTRLDTRVKAIQLTENSGAYIARNTGVSAACRDWTHLTFIDPDDVAQPNWLHHVLSVLRGREGSVRPFIQRFDIELKKPLQSYFGHCPTLHSRYAWERAGGFLPMRRSGDSEMTLRLSHLAKDGETSVFKSWERTLKCRHIPGSATHQDLRARKVWLEKRNDELASMSVSEMQISSPEIAAWEKCGE